MIKETAASLVKTNAKLDKTNDKIDSNNAIANQKLDDIKLMQVEQKYQSSNNEKEIAALRSEVKDVVIRLTHIENQKKAS
jgi:Flp pilus assembly protein TadG